ncbi:Hypothetical protein NGAL_HAMBI1145_39850 [Neorhizobium galegae bv. officinalis]|uniref:Uncharacterized protein n=1 Tax=Neorhizobium galegae bv. officinalis TaxID=323656 RepID=A0A0T7FRQ5_NEOGA|nr:hypothetical protein [Neorhizobium galegae]CDZ37669.1 Hypothetical protein NGAL_HAMBI1145_39850 [Neorhizobium galegae bv. officinalis]
MTLPINIPPMYVEIKYFLNSYRALSDARSGIRHLEDYLRDASFLLSEWKVIWIGSCTILRTCIDLFQVDARSCINADLRQAVAAEWASIKLHKDQHPIFWEFLRKERDNIIHEYEWAAYEAWLKDDGSVVRPTLALFADRPEDVRTVLMMRGGMYTGRNSLELLREGADWVEERIFSAIGKAGLDPEERRELRSFTTYSEHAPRGGLLSLLGEPEET